MGRIGLVYYNNEFAGVLKEEEPGFSFSYDTVYQSRGIPIGYHFPLDKGRFFSGELFPLFENLVSEGWMLQIQTGTQKLDKSDKFGLLLRNGKDLAGALTVLEERE